MVAVVIKLVEIVAAVMAAVVAEMPGIGTRR
jgi:hypothetical protein